MNTQLKNDHVSVKFNSMRLESWQKNRLQLFADVVAPRLDCEVNYIVFGKQDIRGALSITVFDNRHCVPMQRHFSSKEELFGYVDGYLVAANPDAKWL